MKHRGPPTSLSEQPVTIKSSPLKSWATVIFASTIFALFIQIFYASDNRGGLVNFSFLDPLSTWGVGGSMPSQAAYKDRLNGCGCKNGHGNDSNHRHDGQGDYNSQIHNHNEHLKAQSIRHNYMEGIYAEPPQTVNQGVQTLNSMIMAFLPKGNCQKCKNIAAFAEKIMFADELDLVSFDEEQIKQAESEIKALELEHTLVVKGDTIQYAIRQNSDANNSNNPQGLKLSSADTDKNGSKDVNSKKSSQASSATSSTASSDSGSDTSTNADDTSVDEEIDAGKDPVVFKRRSSAPANANDKIVNGKDNTLPKINNPARPNEIADSKASSVYTKHLDSSPEQYSREVEEKMAKLRYHFPVAGAKKDAPYEDFASHEEFVQAVMQVFKAQFRPHFVEEQDWEAIQHLFDDQQTLLEDHSDILQ